MTPQQKQLEVELKLDSIPILHCNTLSKAFRHQECEDPVEVYLGCSGTVYFLCHNHRGLNRIEFRKIEKYEDLERT